MIIGFVGVPGSGKTYEAVEKIVNNIKLGRKVYTNIDGIQLPECRKAIASLCDVNDFQLETCLNWLTDEQARSFWLHCDVGSLVLIDEVHKLFSNRDWASEKNRHFTEWMSTHRHEGYDVVLITQDIEKIDKHCRSLIEYVYLYSKVNFLGGAVKKTYICYTFHGDSHSGTPMATNKRTYKTEIFPCYQSYVADEVAEKTFMKKVNIFNHPVFYAIGFMLCFLGYLVSQSSMLRGDFLGISKDAVAIGPGSAEASEKPDKEEMQIYTPSDRLPDPDNKQMAQVDYTKEPDPLKMTEYLLPNGKTLYVNNGFVPPGGKFIRNL